MAKNPPPSLVNKTVFLLTVVVILSLGLIQSDATFNSLETWMSDFARSEPRARTMPFNHWLLPGTHDAGSFLPSKLYDQFSYTINWNSSDDMTTRIGFYSPIGHSTAVTHHLNIRGQLEMGARYFDLRFTNGKLPTSRNELYIDHGSIAFETLSSVMSEFVAFENRIHSLSAPATQKCEIVWLRVKITSEISSDLVNNIAVPSFKQLETGNNHGMIYKYLWDSPSFFSNTATDQIIIDAFKGQPRHTNLTYERLCMKDNQRFSGVVYLIIFSPESSTKPTVSFVRAMEGKAAIETLVMVGPAPKHTQMLSVLDKQTFSIQTQAAEAERWPDGYKFGEFRRLYLTSTGSITNSNIFLNSYPIWKYILPSALNFITNDAATEFSQIDEPQGAVTNHKTLGAAAIPGRIRGATGVDVAKSKTMQSVTAAMLRQWTKKKGYIDRSHTHILMLDFCELSCPTAVLYSTLVMQSRLN